MGLLKKYKEARHTRKVKRIVRNKLAEPYAKPSQIAEYAATLPRSIKRAHKLEVRRAYRSHSFTGILSSTQRQILSESVAAQIYSEAEHAERQRAEDREYGVAAAFDGISTAVPHRSRRFGLRRGHRKAVR